MKRKKNDLHSEFNQLKDLMMAIVSKSNEDSLSTSSEVFQSGPKVGSTMGLKYIL